MIQEQKLAIFGAGGHAKVVLDIALCLSQRHAISIFDDVYPEKEILHFRANGNSEMLYHYMKINPDAAFIVAIGNNTIRANYFISFLSRSMISSCVLSHPSAVVAQSAVIGKGSVVMANAVINPNAIIGENVIVNTGVVIEHDCRIGNHVHVSPNATICGGSEVGDYTWIGAGSVIIEGRRIGKNGMIGAGAVVTNDISDNTMAVGIPAKPIKTMCVTSGIPSG